MILTNLDTVPGKQISAHYGVVSGSAVRTKHFGSDLGASIKNFFGGELRAYTKLLNKSREQAVQRMELQAQKAGANAILNIRFATSSIAKGAAEIYVYGTAVTVE